MRKTIPALAAVLALALPVSAQAHRTRAHKAQTPGQLIQRTMGPDTVVRVCWPIAHGTRCDYSTPAFNVLEGEGIGWVWESYADVIRGRVVFP